MTRIPRSAGARWCFLNAGAVLVFTGATLILLLHIDLLRAVPDTRIGSVGSPNAPGVAFDLPSIYGTAAVQHHYGSVVTIIKIIGDADCLEIMQNYSHAKSL